MGLRSRLVASQAIISVEFTPVSPKGVPLPTVTANPPGADEQKTLSALNEYDTVRKEVLHTAQKARLAAADQLQALYAEVTGKAEVTAGDKITVVDYLRGL